MLNKRNPIIDPSQPTIYQIRINGHLSHQWAEWFEGLTITLEENGDTLLTGPVIDQAALHGLLKKVRDLGMPLLSVNRVNPNQVDASIAEPVISGRYPSFKQPITEQRLGSTMETNLLLKRLDEIGQSLERSSHTLALIGLGSVGLELERLDAYSDLDFFVIVETGYKRSFLDDLHWLSALCPIAYCFPNTENGYKILFDDGIFCEFAIFEPEELQTLIFSAGRIVWKQSHVAETISQPTKEILGHQKRSQEWLLGEALTNLYVGMAREKRGEKLSAMRFIQWYAVDRLLELAEQTKESQPVARDEFAPERRFEQRYPEVARYASLWMQGCERNRESALAILAFLEQQFEVNAAMAAAIRVLCV